MENQCDFLEELRIEMDCAYISDLKILARRDKYFQHLFLERILNETDMDTNALKDAVLYLCGQELHSDTAGLCREEIKKLLRKIY